MATKRPVDNFGNYGADTPEGILARFQQLKLEQQMFAVEWQEIADYVTPRKNSILVERYPGQKRTQRLYDSTALDCREKLASSIHGTVMPAYIQWFSLFTGDRELDGDPEVMAWFQDAAAKHRTYLNDSNLDQEAHEVFTDLGSFGTGNLFSEQAPPDARGGFGGFRFRSVNVGKFVASEGADGRVNTVFRHFPMTVSAIRTRWLGDSENTLTNDQQRKALREATDSRKADQKLTIVHAVYPASETMRAPNRSRYFLMAGKVELQSGEFKDFPFMVPRWAKIEDETYGRGPSHDALPDIRSLNKIVELELRGMALNIQRPLLTGPDVIGPIRMVPGGQTTVRGDPRTAVMPLDVVGNFQVVNLKKAELVASIRAIYFYDQLQLPQGPQMTAEEVITRLELMYRLLGPTAGRIDAEFARPLIDRTWNILIQEHLKNPNAGVLPQIPEKLQNAMRGSRINLRVRFEGPLARAQKSADTAAVQAVASFVGGLAAVKPDVVDVIDFDDAVREYAAGKGAPARVIRSAEAVAQIRDDRAKKEAAANQAAMQSQVADAAGKVAPLVKASQKASEPGSLASQLDGALNQNGASAA